MITYTQCFSVTDPQALLDAARAHPDAQGMPTEEFYDGEGEVNLGVCIAMLMDPGSLPGCVSYNHQVEQE